MVQEKLRYSVLTGEERVPINQMRWILKIIVLFTSLYPEACAALWICIQMNLRQNNPKKCLTSILGVFFQLNTNQRL